MKSLIAFSFLVFLGINSFAENRIVNCEFNTKSNGLKMSINLHAGMAKIYTCKSPIPCSQLPQEQMTKLKFQILALSENQSDGYPLQYLPLADENIFPLVKQSLDISFNDSDPTVVVSIDGDSSLYSCQ